jgi:2-deoxy-D-gluconate 3-dehydrogenase
VNPFDLTGKIAIVTGGNGGIGLGIARGLVGAGAHVVVAARNQEKNSRAVEELNALGGGGASDYEVDVTDEARVDRLIADTVADKGGLNILVNNAGIGLRKRPEEYTLEEYRRVISINQESVFMLCRASHAPMKAAGGGKIVNIGSMTSIFGHPLSMPYATSKGGVVQMARSLAIAWAPDNIQVNAILPGWIDTDLTIGARKAVPDLDQRVLMRTPAGRWGRPDDLAGTAVFLCSAASDFVTGTAIPVDGGYAIQLP